MKLSVCNVAELIFHLITSVGLISFNSGLARNPAPSDVADI